MRSSVLCFSGLDPSGGAGLQADIESIGSSGAHAAIICTALTIQNSQQVFGFQSIDSQFLAQQAKIILKDLPIQAIKTGMLGSVEVIKMLFELFSSGEIRANIPFVLDPVLSANSGGSLGDKHEIAKNLVQLLPFTTLITPNSLELRILTNEQNLHTAAQKLCKQGAKAVLVKTSHDFIYENFQQFLYIDSQIAHQSNIQRLDGEFHGSGCTLASYIAGRLAQGDDLIEAVKKADAWIYQTLVHADAPHPDKPNAQKIPKRFL